MEARKTANQDVIFLEVQNSTEPSNEIIFLGEFSNAEYAYNRLRENKHEVGSKEKRAKRKVKTVPKPAPKSVPGMLFPLSFS